MVNDGKIQMQKVIIKKIIILSCYLLGLGLVNVQAQSNTVANGGEATGSGGTVSYSVGQVDYITAIGSGGIITQGVQQPYEILITTGLVEDNDILLQSTTYPNPASDYIMLKVENYKSENLTYQLYDVTGKNLENKKIDNTETNIVLSTLAPATYFLKIIQNDKEIKSFKIIKNK